MSASGFWCFSPALPWQDQGLTCQDAIDAAHHQLCIFHAEAHGGFELDHVLPGAIAADADSVLLLQPYSKPELTPARGGRNLQT